MFLCNTHTACIQKIVPLHHRYNVGLKTERKDGIYLVQWEWLAWHANSFSLPGSLTGYVAN